MLLPLSKSAIAISKKAKEDAETWFKVNAPTPIPVAVPLETPHNRLGSRKPESNSVKCNIGCSWDPVTLDWFCFMVGDHMRESFLLLRQSYYAFGGLLNH